MADEPITDLQDIEVILDTVTKLDQLTPARRKLVLEFFQRRYAGDAPARVVGRIAPRRSSGSVPRTGDGKTKARREDVYAWVEARVRAFDLELFARAHKCSKQAASNWMTELLKDEKVERIGQGRYRPTHERARTDQNAKRGGPKPSAN